METNLNGVNMNKLVKLAEANAKAIVALAATLLAGVGLDLPVEVQAAIVTVVVWLIPNKS
jgi:hypothetical protein